MDALIGAAFAAPHPAVMAAVVPPPAIAVEQKIEEVLAAAVVAVVPAVEVSSGPSSPQADTTSSRAAMPTAVNRCRLPIFIPPLIVLHCVDVYTVS